MDISFLVRSLLFESPTIAVWLCGLMAGLVLLTRAPGPALLVMIACALELLASFGYNVIFYTGMKDQTLSTSEMDALTLVRNLVSAGAWLVMFAAAILWRRPQPLYPIEPAMKPVSSEAIRRN